MNCTCLPELMGKLKAEYSPSSEFTNIGFAYNLKLNTVSDAPEPIRFRYHPLKADGTASKKWRNSHVAFNFCPLCGAPMDPKEKA